MPLQEAQTVTAERNLVPRHMALQAVTAHIQVLPLGTAQRHEAAEAQGWQ